MDISALRDRNIPHALSVSELNTYVKRLLDSDRALISVTVTGEISNFTDHRSGHLYFSLKDSDAQIKAVMFRSQRQRLKFMPSDGMRVTVHGTVSLYSQTGTVQLYANSMDPDGVGALYKAYEQLKEKLSLEGLFDEDKKKLLPEYPMRIGVITSPTGAAVRDIINVTGRRFPLATLYLYPALVQGEGAEASLINALDYLDRSGLVDVIIIGRGGGSIEDLWAFNSERLARRIFDARVPIISAVGHETDFTICDFVADMRAPTPSAAAEIAVPDMRELSLRIDGAYDRLVSALLRITDRRREKLQELSEREIFLLPEMLFSEKREAVQAMLERCSGHISKKLSDATSEYKLLVGKCEALSPLSVLSRGYSIAEHCGRAVRTSDDISVGDVLKITFNRGNATVTVKEKE